MRNIGRDPACPAPGRANPNRAFKIVDEFEGAGM